MPGEDKVGVEFNRPMHGRSVPQQWADVKKNMYICIYICIYMYICIYRIFIDLFIIDATNDKGDRILITRRIVTNNDDNHDE